MGTRLYREVFAPGKHIDEFQSFCCGKKGWERAPSDWIRGTNPDNSVLSDIQQYGTRVWVYYTEEGELVGFGSLGTSKWTLPGSGNKKQRVEMITQKGARAWDT